MRKENKLRPGTADVMLLEFMFWGGGNTCALQLRMFFSLLLRRTSRGMSIDQNAVYASKCCGKTRLSLRGPPFFDALLDVRSGLLHRIQFPVPCHPIIVVAIL